MFSIQTLGPSRSLALWSKFLGVVLRKRVFAEEELEKTDLKRCLNRWDLTALGLGSTLGVGVYALVGAVALQVAGPSIVLSFLIAAVAAVLSGLCYAEFAARVPKVGSAYIYTYVAMGELVAFLIGWNMTFELIFAAASVGRGLSMTIDSMVNGTMSVWLTTHLPIQAAPFSPYFDLCAFCAIIFVGMILVVGARESTTLNNVLVVLYMAVILFIIFAGAFTANTSNWSIPETEVPAGFGVGGFFPYGTWGMLQGAALCFYGFVGFETICATAEEVVEPRRSIPQSIIIVLTAACLGYSGVAIVVTMMAPYYLLDKVSAAATVFTYVNWDWARWVVSIGTCFGLAASLFGAMFPLPRLLYAMSCDGLQLRWFSHLAQRSRTPLVATLVSTAVICIVTAVMELEQMVLMLCTATLLSYTLVAASVVILRYRAKNEPELRSSSVMQTVLGCGDRTPTNVTSWIAITSLFLYMAVCVSAAVVGGRGGAGGAGGAGAGRGAAVVPALAALHAAALLLLLVITLQPQSKEDVVFKTPLVPVVPCVSIYVNIHLMVLVSARTWLRNLIWILIGIFVYALCLYCYKRPISTENKDSSTNKSSGMNGKLPLKIVVEAPTPSSTLNRSIAKNLLEDNKVINVESLTKSIQYPAVYKDDDIIVQQAVIENNEEKEAKIIDLLDQVLQAEEDSYIEEISLKEEETESPEQEIMVPLESTEGTVTLPHRKSLSELSDAESEASLTTQDLKYSVIAQVHREDLPKVNEEEEKQDLENSRNFLNQSKNFNETTNDAKNDATIENITNEEDATDLDDCETNSRTDAESGYSDTIDKNALNDSIEESLEVSRIPTPPPLDENYFNSPFLLKKSYSIPSRPSKLKLIQNEEEEGYKPRESVQSNASGHSQDDGNIVFGSHRQVKFMNKLNTLFQSKITAEPDSAEEQRKRSNSAGDVSETIDSPKLMYERPSFFLDLKRELMSMHSVPNLRPVNTEDVEQNKDTKYVNDEPSEDSGLSRDELKSKLETIFATGGPKLLKPRLIKSNPTNTPEGSHNTDTSSNESIAKLPKIEKNDTLKRQKDKFGAVLNSFRLSLNKDDEV